MRTIRPDPIITEVRAIRDEYAARFDYDVGKMFRDLRDRQNASGRKYVCYPARRPSIDLNGSQGKGAGETRDQLPTKGTERQ